MMTQITSGLARLGFETGKDKLLQVRRAGLFIGSVWAYGLDEGEQFMNARALWTPYQYSIVSGRLSTSIKEWAPVPVDSTEQLAEGTGELEYGKELLMNIFGTMAAEGMLKLIAVPDAPLKLDDQTTSALVQRDMNL